MPPKKYYLKDGNIYELLDDGTLSYVCDAGVDLPITENGVCEPINGILVELDEHDEKFLCSPHNRKERRHKPGYEGAQWKQERKKKYF